ncbi:MAG TPA: TetR family transcriptional regulator [Acidimicrobiales bacterium]|nr:TetR family transcriptional regulator [Acidimicrobiales bacterium]
MTEAETDWRQRKKTATRERIRTCALELFRQQGYDATTVEQISAAAGVSHMTFFRYFPTKEDVALSDRYDPLIVEAITRAPATQPLIERIRTVLVQGLRQVYETDRGTMLAQNKLIVSTPALRERLWANQVATQELILDALHHGQAGSHPDFFQDKVVVAACLAAASTAVLTWTENDGTPELPDLMEQAFDILADPTGRATKS